jgi:hypothetical protein
MYPFNHPSIYPSILPSIYKCVLCQTLHFTYYDIYETFLCVR